MQELINVFMLFAEEDGEEAMRIIAGVLPPIVGLICVFVFARGTKRKRLIEDTPTSVVKGIFVGLNEVKGNADLIANLRGYLSEQNCCWYSYTIEEHYTRTTTYTDSEGRTKTRTESGWETVASGSNRVPFDLVDETGAVRVIPTDAEMEGNIVFESRSTPGDGRFHPSPLLPSPRGCRAWRCAAEASQTAPIRAIHTRWRRSRRVPPTWLG